MDHRLGHYMQGTGICRRGRRRIEAVADDALPDDTKLTRTKQRWANEGKFITGAARGADERLPPD